MEMSHSEWQLPYFWKAGRFEGTADSIFDYTDYVT